MSLEICAEIRRLYDLRWHLVTAGFDHAADSVLPEIARLEQLAQKES